MEHFTRVIVMSFSIRTGLKEESSTLYTSGRLVASLLPCCLSAIYLVKLSCGEYRSF